MFAWGVGCPLGDSGGYAYGQGPEPGTNGPGLSRSLRGPGPTVSDLLWVTLSQSRYILYQQVAAIMLGVPVVFAYVRGPSLLLTFLLG